MDLREQSQLEILALLRGRLLSAHQALVALLLSLDTAGVSDTSRIFDADNVAGRDLVEGRLFVITRPARDMALIGSLLSLSLASDSLEDGVDAVDLALTALLGRDILLGVGLVNDLSKALRRSLAHLLRRCLLLNV